MMGKDHPKKPTSAPVEMNKKHGGKVPPGGRGMKGMKSDDRMQHSKEGGAAYSGAMSRTTIHKK